MASILIKPYEQIVKYNINHIQINVSNLELNTKALITTSFFDDTHTIRRQEIDVLEGEEYIRWTNDDYLVMYVCRKYGLTLEK